MMPVMLENVISPVIEALCRAGLRAVRAYPKQALCDMDETLVCVSVSEAKGLPAGFGAYLGIETDPVTGLSEEIYGSRCELELALDIYVPLSAQDASTQSLQTAEAIALALRSLPEGLKISSLSLGPLSPDSLTGRFMCRALLSASACFIARSPDDDGVFTDFILKGSVDNERE